MSDFVPLASFVDRAEAIIARGVLETNGINVLAPDLYTLAADPGLVFAIGGYRVLVQKSQLAEAQALLRDIAAESAKSSD